MCNEDMKSRFKLSADDIKPRQENALDLFYLGIKSKEGRRTMDGNLKRFLVEACADILDGDYKKRTQEFVNLVKEDQSKATNIVLAYVTMLRDKTALPIVDPDYLNPSSLPNKIKPIRKLLEMNGLGLAWKRIYSIYPGHDNTNKGRGYTRAEIQKMLEYSGSIDSDFIILASSSGGFRVGAWSGQKWGNVFPIFEINGQYKVDLEKNEIDNTVIVCAAMKIYSGTPDEHITLISIEAWNKLQEYKKVWKEKMKRSPTMSDPLILERYSQMIPLTDCAVQRRIRKIAIAAGLLEPLVGGKRRHEVPLTHGFRRYWDKIMMETVKKRDTLSALVIKERLMGHSGIVSTDKNYYWTDVHDMVPEYLKAMPSLMIGEESRLKYSLESAQSENKMLVKANMEKEEALHRLAELEAKVARMQKYSSHD